ncbi:MAG: metalloregulator ArsR/SmtB family transcription factor [Isosphaeraceae bacterium]
MALTIPDAVLDRMAGKFRMLSDPTRLAILRAILPGEQSVGQVVAATGLSQANVSKHLKILASSGMVSRRKEGLHAYYAVSDPLVETLCELVCGTIVRETRTQMEESCRLLLTWQGQEAGTPTT